MTAQASDVPDAARLPRLTLNTAGGGPLSIAGVACARISE
jgi:hypothetical protein